ncbi:MAG TPA: type II secretion system protein [Candidatus Saccharimonadales bacterium]
MNVQKQEKGFTIIEVVLVLAIAALIFLMIFIALPALQRGQRDTARKNDANTVATAFNTWRGNHRGSLPNLASGGTNDKTDFLNNYVKQLNQYDATDENSYDFGLEPGEDVKGGGEGEEATEGLSLDVIGIALRAQCNDAGDGTESSSSRSVAVLVRLEASNAIVCTDA